MIIEDSFPRAFQLTTDYEDLIGYINNACLEIKVS